MVTCYGRGYLVDKYGNKTPMGPPLYCEKCGDIEGYTIYSSYPGSEPKYIRKSCDKCHGSDVWNSLSEYIMINVYKKLKNV